MNLDVVVSKFYQEERIRTSRRLGRFLAIKDKSREVNYVLAHSYGRWLDNVVDEATDQVLAERILDEQATKFKVLLEGGHLEATTVQDEMLEYLKTHSDSELFQVFLDMINGIKIDSQVARTGQVMDRAFLETRNLSQYMPFFQLVSITAFGRRLEYGKEFEQLVKTWIDYDALRDLKEDLRMGLVLIASEELVEYGINLQPGKPVPSNFNLLVDRKKGQTMRNLVLQASAVETTNIPFLERQALRLYFMSRSIKLAASNCRLPPGFIYNTIGTAAGDIAPMGAPVASQMYRRSA